MNEGDKAVFFRKRSHFRGSSVYVPVLIPAVAFIQQSPFYRLFLKTFRRIQHITNRTDFLNSNCLVDQQFMHASCEIGRENEPVFNRLASRLVKPNQGWGHPSDGRLRCVHPFPNHCPITSQILLGYFPPNLFIDREFRIMPEPVKVFKALATILLKRSWVSALNHEH